MRKGIIVPVLIVLLLTAATALGFSGTAFSPDRDFQFYQAFVESLAGGNLDLSIPGFHGSNVLAVPWYWLTHSPTATIDIQVFYALLLPAAAYMAGKSFFKSQLHGLLLAGVVTMMPFVSMISSIGYTSAGLFTLMLLTIYGSVENKRWTPITFGLAVLTKPFALALLPLLWIKRPQASSFIRRNAAFFGLLIPVMYLILQYAQTGRVIVGVHPELDALNVWQDPLKILLNVAYALQILFSVHNYHYPNPAGTGHENLIHTTPVLIFLGLFALIAQSEYFKDKKVPAALLAGVLIGFGLNAVSSTMNEYYMQAGVLLLIFASVPVLIKHPVWIPIALATLHFQWFYFYLAFSERLQLTNMLFAVPAVVDMLFMYEAIRWMCAEMKNEK